MKRLFIILFLILNFIRTDAQLVTIPDAAFVNYLTMYFPLCMNGNQMDTTCSEILSAIGISISGVSDLDGVQYFDNLQTLYCAGNQLTSLPRLPNTLLNLYCGNNQITTLPSLPISLQILQCSNNQLTSLPALPLALQELRCGSNPITSIPILPSGLLTLSTGSCRLTNLPSLPNSLEYLDCSFDSLLISIDSLPPALVDFNCIDCNLNLLPTLPSSLISLDCSYNQLGSLPAIPSALESLTCIENQLTALPALPSTLKSLTCRNNQITSLPLLPNVLEELVCSANQISTLPTLPDSLHRLICSQNQIAVLPNFNSTLNLISCDVNMLSAVPPLPPSVEFFSCGNNQITILPALDSALEILICDYNQISVIPTLPRGLRVLICPSNLISSLPELPDSMQALQTHDNPLLTCLPKFKKIYNLSFLRTGIQCLPNYGIVTYCSPPQYTLPLCDPLNINSCEAFWNIAGRTFSDVNNDCVSDISETGLKNIKIQLSQNNVLTQQTFSQVGGVYSFAADTGTYTYTIDTTELPVVLTCPPAGFHTSILTLADSVDSDMNFGFTCKPGFDIGVNSIILRTRNLFPGDSAIVNIGAGDFSSMYGMQCASGINGEVVVNISGPVTYLSPVLGALTPTVSGNTLTYTITNFGNVDFRNDFRIIFLVNTTAQIGDSVCIEVSVAPVTGDNVSSNNVMQNCFIVGNSYDPNTKEVNPEGDIAADQEWLTYTIHFQNTGVAPARHVYITDTLDANLEAATFELLAYSHNVSTRIIGNKIEFDFPDINLPDSTSDEANSHGYVQYKIKPIQGLSVGSQIRNTARIYFDFNSAIITNTIVTNVSLPVGVSIAELPSDITIYPNPTSNDLNILTLKNKIEKVEVIDMYGKIILVRENVNASSVHLSLDKFSRGIYFLKIYARGEVVKKIVVN